MTKVTINENFKKIINHMSKGDIFINSDYYYMYIDLDIIIRLSDFTVWNFTDFTKGEYVICDAEIIIHK